MKHAAICALFLLLPAAGAAAVLQSAYLPPADGPVRKVAPERRKPLPAPAPTHHYAGPPGLPQTWTN